MDRILLSESTAWSGRPSATDVNPEALAHLAEIRQLLFAQEYERAHEMTERFLLGRPDNFGTNLPLPEVVISQLPGNVAGDIAGETAGSVTQFRRGLDLSTAIAGSQYTRGRTHLRTEVFSSRPDRVVAYAITASDDGGGPKPGALDFRVSIGAAVFELEHAIVDGDLVAHGRAVESLHSSGVDGSDLWIAVRVMSPGGQVVAAGSSLEVRAGSQAHILIAVGTNWDGAVSAVAARTALDEAAGHTIEQLRHRHIADYAPLYERAALDLGRTDPEVAALPYDKRKAAYSRGGHDPELEALYFQFGRYLTIAGSRHDSPLPLALQGLWNDGLASSAPWTNDFHLDVNTQQNYWAAEVTGLGECVEPLVGFTERLAATGQDTAARMYGARGWVAHTVSNAWGYSAPGKGMGWGMHVTGGAWLSVHLWERWEFGRDLDYLRDRAYPVLKGVAEFYLDYLVAEPEHGWLVTGPSDSAEHWFLSKNGKHCAVSMGSTGDRVFVEAVLAATEEGANILGIDPDLAERISAARAKLPPFQIGRHGQLQEWLHDFEEADPGHRHTTHLSGLFPLRQIRPRLDPELARAIEVTIARRESAEGWEQTEWVEANFINYYARLLKGDRAHHHVRNLITDASAPNLMTFSVGGVAGAAANIYSFDGNAGGTGGMAEMLVQSDGCEIELLPALPAVWPRGSVRGLRARGGITVDVTWADGKLVAADLMPRFDGEVQVRLGECTRTITLTAGLNVTISGSCWT